MQENTQGRFITVEGGEGVGKSLFCDLLSRELDGLGISHHRSREPGGTPLAEKIRTLFSQSEAGEQMSPATELFLISAARSQHVAGVILPALKKGVWVLCDRFADSSRVYQGLVGGLPSPAVEAIVSLSTGGLNPDLTFLLDCDPEVSARRVRDRGRTRGGTERYDQAPASTHGKLRGAYLQLAEAFPGRFVRLDASGNPQECLREALKELKKRFSLD